MVKIKKRSRRLVIFADYPDLGNSLEGRHIRREVDILEQLPGIKVIRPANVIRADAVAHKFMRDVQGKVALCDIHLAYVPEPAPPNIVFRMGLALGLYKKWVFAVMPEHPTQDYSNLHTCTNQKFEGVASDFKTQGALVSLMAFISAHPSLDNIRLSTLPK